MIVVLLQGPAIFHPWLSKLNAAALAANIPWTSVALLDGDTVHIGPTIRPRVTACYKCFELRYKSNLLFLNMSEALDAYVRKANAHVDFGIMPPVAEIVAGFAAMEVVRTLSPDSVPQTSGRLMIFHVSDFSTEYHSVLKLPRCSACSQALGQPGQRIWS